MKILFNKKLKKLSIYFLTIFLTSLTIMYSYIFIPETLNSIDNRLRDYMFNVRGELEKGNNIVIIDIDEKSIKKIGQWPWSRNTVSNLLEKLTQSNVGIIGLDIVFAEKDRTSPHLIAKKLNIPNSSKFENYDEIFAKTIATTPTILGYQFDMQNEKVNNFEAPILVGSINKKTNANEDHLLEAKGIITNIPILQNNSYSSGFFNNVPDPSGIIRSVPLVIKYKDELYTSLTLEIIRAIAGSQNINIHYDEFGIDSIQVGDFNIPTNQNAKLMINYRGKEKSFPYISAIDILNDNFDKSLIEGKIVLIGTSAAALLDLRATPFESIYPGVEVHASAIDNILTQSYLQEPAFAMGKNIIIIFLICAVVILTIAYIKALMVPFALVSIVTTFIYYLYYQLTINGEILNILFPIIAFIISAIVGLTINYLLEKRNELLIKRKFASKVSKDVMDSLLENPHNDAFEAMEKEITIFFSDIRNFTTISENMNSPKELVDYLNKYMTPMSDIIIEEKGTIDKYIGDSIMAYWNAPQNVENHANRTLDAALRQISYLKELNKYFIDNNLPKIEIGIGINTGLSTVGEMGSSQRSDYTCLGDSVNIASRLEYLCKEYGVKIIISEHTKDKLTKAYNIRKLDLVKVKGKNKSIEIFEVMIETNIKDIQEYIKNFNKAIDLYRDSNFQEALDSFCKIKNLEDSNDNLVNIYINRCKKYMSEPIKQFDGIQTY